MIKIYHVPNSRSLRVVWLMEELGEAYEVERVAFPPDAAFRAVNPTGSIPAIVDGDIVMGESLAILQYLTGRRLQQSMEMKITVGPNPDPAAYAEHLQFLHLGEASLMMPLDDSVQNPPHGAGGREASKFTTELASRCSNGRLGVIETDWRTGGPS